jgi:hypothetical protein
MKARYVVIWTDSEGVDREEIFAGKSCFLPAKQFAKGCGGHLIRQERRARVVWEWVDTDRILAAPGRTQHE